MRAPHRGHPLFLDVVADASAFRAKEDSDHGLFERFEPFTSDLSLRAKTGEVRLTKKYFLWLDTQSLGSTLARNPTNDTVDGRSASGLPAITTRLGKNTLSRLQRFCKFCQVPLQKRDNLERPWDHFPQRHCPQCNVCFCITTVDRQFTTIIVHGTRLIFP